MLKHLNEKFIHYMAEYFFEFEKRKHYYKLANNLYNSYVKGKKFNRSLLKKVKEDLSLWIDNPNQIQVYARFLNEIEKDGVKSFGEGLALIPLINLYREVWRELEEEEDKVTKLRDYILKLDACEICTRGLEGEDFFNCLLENVDFLTATHIANYFFEEEFLPLNEEIARTLNISKENYFEVIKKLKGANLKNLYGALYVLLQRDNVKVNHVKRLLGISREAELLKEAVYAWNTGDFYKAHEILEEIWGLFKNEDIKKCYRGLIRSAIALHKLKEGNTESGLNVVKQALLDMANCPDNFRGINLGEIRAYLEEVLGTKEIGNPPELKYNIKSGE
ncbi:MAG: hypothetical protein DSY32_03335 [Aquifex sp.]|nr:MAG: hypothetical protein DSY32_03335 [Aquifex sp.]